MAVMGLMAMCGGACGEQGYAMAMCLWCLVYHMIGPYGKGH